ncbi:tetratricopeptide repeat protein [Cytophagaceae bacterium ABcell3]|nr:tetratricopeptide repeat protein [Cytophagaceae bacterium ABcell3]
MIEISFTERVVHKFHPFFIVATLLLFSSPLKAQFAFTPETKEAYQNLIKLKTVPASQQLSKALQKKPTDGIAIYLENYIDVLTVFINEDPELYKQLLPNENKRLEQLKNLDKKSPWYLFTMAEVKLQWAFVKAKSGDEISAAWSIRQAYKMLEENQRKYPDFLPNKKSFGLMHILIGSIPEKYLWIAKLAGMHGKVPTGLSMLDEVIAHDKTYALESQIIKLSTAYYILNEKNLTDIKQLYQKHPDNLLLSFIYSSILMKETQSEAALKVLSTAPSGTDYLSLPFLHYMHGLIYLNKGDYHVSQTYFHRYLKMHKGSNFIKDTWFRLFLTHWLPGKHQEAEKSLSKVLTQGAAVYDADKYAESFAKKRHFPNKQLMKARLFTDGGYNDLAIKSLDSISLKELLTPSDNIEYHYRYARVYHKTGNLQQAIEKYQETINVAEHTPLYFAPNAALQLGYIFKSIGDIQKAEEYFNLALSFKNHEYKNSIDNKAKAALSEIGK